MESKAYQTPIRVIVSLLLVVSLLLGSICMGAFMLFTVRGVYDDIDSRESDFWNSSWVWRYAREQTWRVIAWIDYGEMEAQDGQLSYSEQQNQQQIAEAMRDSNLRARVILGDGREMDTPGETPVERMTPIIYLDLSEDSYSYWGWEATAELDIQGIQWYADENMPVDDALREAKFFFADAYRCRWQVIWLGAAMALLALCCWVYLLCAAGHRHGKKEISLNGFDRIPFDVLTVLLLGAVFLLLSLAFAFGVEDLNVGRGSALAIETLYVAVAIAPSVIALSLVLLWTITLSARAKAHVLLRGTLCWRFGAWLTRLLRRAVGRASEAAQEAQTQGKAGARISGLLHDAGVRMQGIRWRDILPVRACRAVWGLVRHGCRQLMTLVRGIGVAWKLCGLTAFILILYAVIARGSYFSSVALLLLLLLGLAVFLGVGFFALQLDRLKTGGEKLAAGDLGYKTDTAHMYWDLKKHAENLNSISDGMSAAVEQRLKSERLKYELLTNVSHDIKTPLTSIVNYVELLKSEPIENEQAREYIAVLDRQAARLKKLIADLIEASKASTGNITVHAVRTDVAELLRQCVGEYNERFAACQLTAMLDLPESEPQILADGRLLWRVFDNLLGNIIKYAMPGTRVYFDLEDCGGRVVISLKNISRDRLNIAPYELMERFVRGDVSRATEGSGLGLSIARSLTELMGGRLDILVDGDLFKISLFFDQIA